MFSEVLDFIIMIIVLLILILFCFLVWSYVIFYLIDLFSHKSKRKK